MRDVLERTEFGLAVGGIEKIHGDVSVVTGNPRLAARHRNDIPATLLKQVSQHVAAGQAGGTCNKCGTLCLRHLSSLLYVTSAEIRAATTLRTTRPRAQAHAPSKPGREPRLADLVDAIRVKRDVILDLRHRFKRGLISPHRVARTITAGWNAVVGSVALVGAVRGVFAACERGHIDIPAGDILNGRIGRLAKRQRLACVGDNLAADFDHTRERFGSIEMGWSGPGIFIDLSAMICILLNWKRYLGIQKPSLGTSAINRRSCRRTLADRSSIPPEPPHPGGRPSVRPTPRPRCERRRRRSSFSGVRCRRIARG